MYLCVLLEIALISLSNEKNKLILATSFGNTNLKCNGEDESAAVIKYGWKVDENYNNSANNNITRIQTLENRWSDDYHTFELFRSTEGIVFKIDGETTQWNSSDLPLAMDYANDEVKKLVIYNMVT